MSLTLRGNFFNIFVDNFKGLVLIVGFVCLYVGLCYAALCEAKPEVQKSIVSERANTKSGMNFLIGIGALLKALLINVN